LLNLFQGIKPVKRATAVRDALAGVVFAAMDIPQALGYTRIAGMPIVTGLYSLLLPFLAFAAFGSSRYLVVAADSATAAILRSGLAEMAPAASARYVALAGLVALLTAAFLLLARLCKLGFVADFLSQTVLVGFLTGVGFQVGITVLGQMLGIETDSRRTLVQLYEVCRSLPKVHLPTMLVTVAVLATVFALRPQSTRFIVGCRRRHRGQRNLELRRARHHHHRPRCRRPAASWMARRALERRSPAGFRRRIMRPHDPHPERSNLPRLCDTPP
jgi:SulP family sulfate permease